VTIYSDFLRHQTFPSAGGLLFIYEISGA